MKINTVLWIVVLVVAGVGGLVFLGGDISVNKHEINTQSSSALTSDKLLYDFGEVDIFSGKVTTDFALTNEGVEDIAIKDGTTSCSCTEGEIGGIRFGMHENMSKAFIIPAGETRTLTVIYDPLKHGPSGVGLAERSIYLRTNSSTTPQLEVRIRALVTNNN